MTTVVLYFDISVVFSRTGEYVALFENVLSCKSPKALFDLYFTEQTLKRMCISVVVCTTDVDVILHSLTRVSLLNFIAHSLL